MQVTWRKFLLKLESDPSVVAGYVEPYIPEGMTPEQFLDRVLTMPRAGKRPISYDDANNLFGTASLARMTLSYEDICRFPHLVKLAQHENKLFLGRFFEWISEQGYYIELRGDEYRAVVNLQ